MECLFSPKLTRNDKTVSSSRLILASASPRRKELLELAEIDFGVIPADVDESLLPGEEPTRHVLRLSEKKALAVADRYPDAWVIGADTLVTLRGEIFGKPRQPSEATAMLRKLSGLRHSVITGFTILRKATGALHREAVTSRVVFREITENELRWYLKTSEPYDKAGGYAAQGKASLFIKEIQGSFTNVVGLPLCEVIGALKKLGAIYCSAGGSHVGCSS